MPYLDDDPRARIDRVIKPLQDAISIPGHLNYAICKLTERAVLQQYDLSYHTLSKFHAAIQDAADEFQRRVIDTYEDEARAKYGDVFQEIIMKVFEKFPGEKP